MYSSQKKHQPSIYLLTKQQLTAQGQFDNTHQLCYSLAKHYFLG